MPLLGCHGWMLASVIARYHCWVPLREKIGQNDTPFSAASFSTLITHELACAIWGLCWYNSLDVSRDYIRPVFATGPQPPERPWKLIQKIPGKPAPSKKKPWKRKGCPSHCHIASKNITKKKHKKKTIILLRVIPTMTCRVVVVR